MLFGGALLVDLSSSAPVDLKGVSEQGGDDVKKQQLFPLVRMPVVRMPPVSVESAERLVFTISRGKARKHRHTQPTTRNDEEHEELRLLPTVRRKQADLPSLTKKGHARSRGRRQKKKQYCDLAASLKTDLATSLRSELAASLESGKALALAISADVGDAFRLVGPVEGHAAALQYMQCLGMEKLQRSVARMQLSKVGSAWSTWLGLVREAAARKEEVAWRKSESIRRLFAQLERLATNQLEEGFAKWHVEASMGRASAHRAAMQLAAVNMQRCARGHFFGRLRRDRRRVERDIQWRRSSASKIANAWRRFKAKSLSKRLREAARRDVSATMIQATARGGVKRTLVARAKKMRRQNEAATVIQCVQRSRAARVELQIRIEQRKRKNAAQMFQRGIRRKRAAERTRLFRRYKLEKDAATLIQSLHRGITGRLLVEQLALEREIRREAQRGACTLIQRRARGYLCRLVHGDLYRKIKERRLQHRLSSTSIQKVARQRAARVLVKRLKKERLAQMIIDARSCTEAWSDEDAHFCYFSDATRETLWEPPTSGYVRRDGQLVLTDGRIMEDPLDVLAESQRAQSAADAAAEAIFGRLAAQVNAPLADVAAFLEARMNLPDADVRMVRDERFDELCVTLQGLANDLHRGGRLGKPGHIPKVDAPPVVEYREAAPTVTATNVGGLRGDLLPPPRTAQHMQQEAQEAVGYEEEKASEQAFYQEEEEEDVGLAVMVQQSSSSWEEYTDEVGTAYYYNPSTGESTYDPREAAPAWTQHEDDAGSPFWYNATTGVSQYETPDGEQEPDYGYEDGVGPENTTGDFNNDDWQSLQDADGNWYNYNSVTGESFYVDHDFLAQEGFQNEEGAYSNG